MTSLYYVPFAQRLLSAGEDSVVVSWCMRSKRKEVGSSVRGCTTQTDSVPDARVGGVGLLSEVFQTLLLEPEGHVRPEEDRTATASLPQVWQSRL